MKSKIFQLMKYLLFFVFGFLIADVFYNHAFKSEKVTVGGEVKNGDIIEFSEIESRLQCSDGVRIETAIYATKLEYAKYLYFNFDLDTSRVPPSYNVSAGIKENTPQSIKNELKDSYSFKWSAYCKDKS